MKFLPQFLEEAKASLLTSITCSTDAQVLECLPALHNSHFLQSAHIPFSTVQAFQDAIDRFRAKAQPAKKKKILMECKKNHLRQICTTMGYTPEQITVQNSLAGMLPLGADDHLWNRLLTGMPAGQLSFVIRASCDCLPTPSSLVHWGYSLSHSCLLCNGSHCNVQHILNCCPTALSDGRYTWRRDQVQSKVYSFLRKFLPSAAKLFVDLPNHRVCESLPATVPPDIVVTMAIPDIIILHDRRITILELTVPWNSTKGIQMARRRRMGKDNYQRLVLDLSSQGYYTKFLTLEIGCLGHCTQGAFTALKAAAPLSQGSDRRAALIETAKAAISSSSQIFLARKSPWGIALN